jgi:hypothetical protein
MWVRVCYRCKGTGNVLIWLLDHPVLVGCTYCSGTGEAKGD